MIEIIGNTIKEEARVKTREIIVGVLEGASDIIIETIGAISLVGCTILIIMKVTGYDKGYKQAGILFVADVLVKAIIGGDK